MRFLKARGSAEPRKVASGYARQGLQLRNGKVRSQVSGIDRSQFPGRRTVGEVKVGERRASDRAEKRIYRFGVDLVEREEQVVCHASALAMTDEARREGGDVSLAIFITSVSGSESLTSFTNRTFYLSRSPGFWRAFDAAERNERFGRIQCQRGKRRVFLCRGTVGVKVGGKVIPASFLKIEERRTLVGAKDRKHLPGARKSKRRRSKGNVRRGATANLCFGVDYCCSK